MYFQNITLKKVLTKIKKIYMYMKKEYEYKSKIPSNKGDF